MDLTPELHNCKVTKDLDLQDYCLIQQNPRFNQEITKLMTKLQGNLARISRPSFISGFSNEGCYMVEYMGVNFSVPANLLVKLVTTWDIHVSSPYSA